MFTRKESRVKIIARRLTTQTTILVRKKNGFYMGKTIEKE